MSYLRVKQKAICRFFLEACSAVPEEGVCISAVHTEKAQAGGKQKPIHALPCCRWSFIIRTQTR